MSAWVASVLENAGEAALVLVIAAVVFGIRALVLNRLKRWQGQSPVLARDIGAVRRPSFMWATLVVLGEAVRIAPLPLRIANMLEDTVHVLLIFSITWVLANLTAAVVDRSIALRTSGMLPGITLTLIRGVIWIVGLLVLVSQLGVTITPMITALGVTGLAVSLAMQDTLSNFFAGIFLMLDRPLKLGDFVRLENGQEGRVVNISWRTTRLRTFADDEIVIPNKKLMESVLLNYAHAPEPSASLDRR
jgi:small-conductance mechanosensitive channel